MKRALLSTAIATLVATGTASASVDIDFHNGQGILTVNSFDWTQTSFLAEDGNQAIADFAAVQASGGSLTCADTTTGCQFEVFVHAVLSDAAGTGFSTVTGLNTDFEVTMTLSFTETVTGLTASPGVVGTLASFTIDTTKSSYINIFYDDDPNSNSLTGYGFDDGRMVAHADTVGTSNGFFSLADNDGDGSAIEIFDQFDTGNESDDNYGDATWATDGELTAAEAAAADGNSQLTLEGTGSQSAIAFGGNITQDNWFFKSILTDISVSNLAFGLINVAPELPFSGVDPSDCFTRSDKGAAAVGTVIASGECDNAHTDDLYANQAVHTGGILPVVGNVNGGPIGANQFAGGVDFVAQVDPNMNFDSIRPVPEPNVLALLGLGFGSIGILGFRNRRKRSQGSR